MLVARLLASDFPSENPRTQTRNFPYTSTLCVIMKKLLQSIFGTKKEAIKENHKIEKRDDSPIPERFSKWINKIESTDLPTDKIIAFNFGLFESSESYMIYLIGSEKYDTEDEDWACDVQYEPKDKYFDLYHADLNNAEWEFVLDFSIKLIKDFMKTEDYKNCFLSKSEYITTGFDDGNLTRLK